MRHDVSERDRLLIRRWRAILQERQALYNVDYSHQCLLEQPSAIVRPFVCAPHFYGCIHCGQHHRCYLNPRDCVAVVDSDSASMSCQYSGQVLPVTAPATWVGNHNYQRDFEECPTTCEEYLAASNKRKRSRANYKPRERLLYTNSRIKMPRGSREKVETHREKKHPEEVQMNNFLSSIGCRTAGTIEAEGKTKTVVEEEMMEEETEETDRKTKYEKAEDDYDACDNGRYTEREQSETNEEYWDDYYSFLDESGLLLPPQTPPIIPMPPTEDVEEIPMVFNETLVNEKTEEEIHERTRVIVENLLNLHLQERKCNTAEEFSLLTSTDLSFIHRDDPGSLLHRRRALQERLIHYFEERIKRIVLLVYNTPQMMTHPEERPPSTLICEALLLNLFHKAFSDEDQYGHRLEIWHVCHWLKEMGRKGIVGILYGEATLTTLENGEKVKKNKKNKRRKRLKTDLNRNKVKQTSETILHCLSHYKGCGFWLRHFIQGSDKS